MAVKRSACVPQRSSTPGFLLSRVAVANVRKRLQASGIERGRSSVQRLMTAELASEAGDMWVNVHGPLLHVFCPSHK